jgi:hypothetical protein
MTAETIKIELELPRAIVDFVGDLTRLTGQSVEEFLAGELVEDIRSILGDLPRSLIDPDKVAKKYGLTGS